MQLLWNLEFGVGGPSVLVLLSLVNEEIALGLVIGQSFGRQGDRTECWKKKGSVANTINLWPEMDIG